MNHQPLPPFPSSQRDYSLPPIQVHQPLGPHPSNSMRPAQAPAPHHHHHHHIIHRHTAMEPGPIDSMSGPPQYLHEREPNEPVFPRPYQAYDGPDAYGEPRPSTTGDNWGKKTLIASRYMRKRRLGATGAYSADFEKEERVRKRVKLLLPSRSPSPPPLEPPGYKDLYSPPVSPHLPPTNLDPNPSFSSFLAAPGTRHSFDPQMLDNLSTMTLDLITSEGDCNRSLGRLFSLLSEKASYRDLDAPSTGDDEVNVDSPNGMDGIKEEPYTPAVPQFPNGVNTSRHPLSPMGTNGGLSLPPAYLDLFVTPGGITLPDRRDLGEADTYFPSAADQVAAVNQWLNQIRGVYDDLREYLRQLDKVHVGIAKAQMGRKRVWAALRTEVAKELDIPLPGDSGEEPAAQEAEKA